MKEFHIYCRNSKCLNIHLQIQSLEIEKRFCQVILNFWPIVYVSYYYYKRVTVLLFKSILAVKLLCNWKKTRVTKQGTHQSWIASVINNKPVSTGSIIKMKWVQLYIIWDILKPQHTYCTAVYSRISTGHQA